MSYSEKLAYAIVGILILLTIVLTVVAHALSLYAIDIKALEYAVRIAVLVLVGCHVYRRIMTMLRSD